jgi:hypothetical protein
MVYYHFHKSSPLYPILSQINPLTLFKVKSNITQILQSYGYQGLFPWWYNGRGMKLTIHLHLVPRSKNEWSYASTPQYASMAWCSVEARGQLYLYLILHSNAWAFQVVSSLQFCQSKTSIHFSCPPCV